MRENGAVVVKKLNQPLKSINVINAKRTFAHHVLLHFLYAANAKMLHLHGKYLHDLQIYQQPKLVIVINAANFVKNSAKNVKTGIVEPMDQ